MAGGLTLLMRLTRQMLFLKRVCQRPELFLLKLRRWTSGHTKK
jgi:hypothetical protein